MEPKIVNAEPRYSKTTLIEPSPHGFLHIAGWYAVETGVDNSMVLTPLHAAPSDYAFINFARWNESLPPALATAVDGEFPELRRGQPGGESGRPAAGPLPACPIVPSISR